MVLYVVRGGQQSSFFMVLYGTVWYCMVLYVVRGGQLSSSVMVLYGTVCSWWWSIVIIFHGTYGTVCSSCWSTVIIRHGSLVHIGPSIDLSL